ncbi:MAG: EamA family transporter, partial [Comamonas sp.]
MHSPLPVFALLFNALIWGLSWWPFRLMHEAGLHPLWATALMYALVLTGLIALRPASLKQAWQYPVLLLLAASSGLNNVAFNWAVTVGDVVRVILLFYLMPAWAVLLAWKLLGERPTPAALLRLLLAFGGVVLVLLPAELQQTGNEALTQRMEQFISSCWDAGLEIGSSVRSIEECLQDAAEDLTLQTAMLESRRICGNAALFEDYQSRYRAQLDPQAFVESKLLEMRQRHAKHDFTPYALEPNCKESPGGLRDLHTMLWLAKGAGFGNSWRELAEKGLITPFEEQQLDANEALLSLIRARLHAVAGRHEDRLVFDLQTTVAEAFGYSSTTPEGKKLAMRASETLMRHYYWAAKAVTQLCQIVRMSIEERLNPSSYEPIALNERFYEKAGTIEVASDDLYEREPHAILETFLMYEHNEGFTGLSSRTLRALYGTRDLMDAAFRRDPVNRATFMKILQQPRGITHAMRLMNQTSVLGRYLWPFRRIVGQMQHDLFHVYTVDQHILMVLRNVR